MDRAQHPTSWLAIYRKLTATCYNFKCCSCKEPKLGRYVFLDNAAMGQTNTSAWPEWSFKVSGKFNKCMMYSSCRSNFIVWAGRHMGSLWWSGPFRDSTFDLRQESGSYSPSRVAEKFAAWSGMWGGQDQFPFGPLGKKPQRVDGSGTTPNELVGNLSKIDNHMFQIQVLLL